MEVPELPFLMHPMWALPDWIGALEGPQAFDDNGWLRRDGEAIDRSFGTLSDRVSAILSERNLDLTYLVNSMLASLVPRDPHLLSALIGEGGNHHPE